MRTSPGGGCTLCEALEDRDRFVRMERPQHPIVSFLTTFSAASITFMVAAHFASIASAAIRVFLAL